GTLQYQSLSLNPADPLNDLLGGTQDNGTHAFSGGNWFVTVFGDGGQSGISAFNSNIRFHNYFEAEPDVNFHGDSEAWWDYIGDGKFWGNDKLTAGYVVATERAPSDNGTLWVGTRRGRVFVTSNANAVNANKVNFFRIDTSSQPSRFVSGIDVDPSNPNHAFI